jgi:hypothetical protein
MYARETIACGLRPLCCRQASAEQQKQPELHDGLQSAPQRVFGGLVINISTEQLSRGSAWPQSPPGRPTGPTGNIIADRRKDGEGVAGDPI